MTTTPTTQTEPQPQQHTNGYSIPNVKPLGPKTPKPLNSPPSRSGQAHRLTSATTPEEQGPLVQQPAPAARLARILFAASCDLQDVSTLHDPAQMYEEARAVASRILAACPME